MEIRKIKRLWNGLASLRSHEIEKYIKTGGVKLELPNGATMTMDVDYLKDKRFQISSRQFQSKFRADQTYELVDFRWVTDGERTKIQIITKKPNDFDQLMLAI